MKAVVFHDIGDVRLEDVAEPRIQHSQDAIVRITSSAICGTDLHMIRGTMPGMASGTIMGHEGVGIVEEVGSGVRNFVKGDRVVICSTIACGYCTHCREGSFSQCDNANPNGKAAGVAFFGGPQSTGPFNGLQAERARIPFANVGMVRIPEEVSDDQAIMISDIFPTGYFGADLAEIMPGQTVVVFGCGPVGQFAILSCMLMGAGRVIAVDRIESRLEMARNQGAEVVNFEQEDPVQAILEMTGGDGADRVIDAVGVDAVRPEHGPAAAASRELEQEFQRELKQVAPQTHPHGKTWVPGNAPGQVLNWAVQVVRKAGRISIIGVYPESAEFFPLGKALGKNLAIVGGDCNHRKYVPLLLELVRNGSVDPAAVLSNVEPLVSVIDAYKAFDERQPGWIKVELVPQMETVAG